jgi:hypothetical protein
MPLTVSVACSRAAVAGSALTAQTDPAAEKFAPPSLTHARENFY